MKALIRIDSSGVETGLSATGLMQQSHLAHHNLMTQGLAHVVNGQRRHGNRHQRFHLHTGLPSGFCGGLEDDFMRGVVAAMSDADHVQGNVVTQGNEVPRLLGSGDTGDFGRGQHVTFLDLIGLNFCKNFSADADSGLRDGAAVGDGFFGHGDHGGAAVGRVNVTEFARVR